MAAREQAAILTVCPPPGTGCDYTTIHEAVQAAASGDEVRVAKGTYQETLDIGFDLTLRGGYTAPGFADPPDPDPAQTVIDAAGADASVIRIGPGTSVVVEGLTAKDADHSSDHGGGLAIHGATVLITNTVVRDNATGGEGGGVLVDDEGGTASVSIVNSSLLSNTAAGDGGALSAGSVVTLTNVEVRDNVAQGGGGGLSAMQLTVVDSQIVGNLAGTHGGGIFADTLSVLNSEIRDNEANGTGSIYGGGISMGLGGFGRLVIQDSTVSNNRAVGTVESIGGGIDAEASEAIIARTVISGNLATAHGGVSLWHAVLTMTNSLVVGNADVGVGGQPVTGTIKHLTATGNEGNGLRVGGGVGGDIEIYSSILWGNGGTDYVCWGGCILEFSDIGSGDPTGRGNISKDPRFVDPAHGDYHLQGASPVVNEGIYYFSTVTHVPSFLRVLDDLDGQPRDGRPDMGAYELERLDNDIALRAVYPKGRKAVGYRSYVSPVMENAGWQIQNLVPVTCEIEYEGEVVFQGTRTTPEALPIAPMWWTISSPGIFEFAEEGEYLITCQSGLAGDQRPENDVISGTFTTVPKIEDVWSRDNWDDDGEEPSDEDDWYQSPDLWVRHDDDGGLWHQDPIAGQTNYVYVRLRNRGAAKAEGSVDLSWLEPSLGTRCDDWSPIATLPFEKLYADREKILKAAWVPSRSGHTCLQSVITATLDPYNTDLACDPLWVPYDNNVAWRNVNIVENPAGPTRVPSGDTRAPQDVLEAEVRLVNVYNLPEDVDLIVERLTFPLAGDIVVQLPADLFDRWQAHGAAWGEGIEVLPATKEIRVSGAVSGTVGAIPLETAEEATVGLRFEADAGLEFETAVRERIGGRTVGGVAYQWVIPDTTPPDVVGVSPGHGATDVPLDAPLVLTFTEEIGPLSLDLDLTPDPGGWDVTWNEAGTVFTLTHAALAPETLHTASVTASDGWANPMTAAFQWSFTGGEPWRVYLPLLLRDD